jgi:hypothetical protein
MPVAATRSPLGAAVTAVAFGCSRFGAPSWQHRYAWSVGQRCGSTNSGKLIDEREVILHSG